jgi:hypothetical protein
MSNDSNRDLLIAAWLDEEARAGAPERLIDATRRELERTNQRRALWPAWRLSPMNMRFAVAAAVIVIAVVGGYLILPRVTSPGATEPTPTASPTASPTAQSPATSTPREIPADGGDLVAGTYVTRPYDTTAPELEIAFTVPANWGAATEWALVSGRSTTSIGNAVGFLSASGVYSDPCRWDTEGTGLATRGDVAVGPTAADLANALADQTAYTSTAPVDTTLAGYTGKSMDLVLPSDVDFSSCDVHSGETDGVYLIWGTPEAGLDNLYAQGPGEHRRLWILDVEGKRIIVFHIFDATETDANMAEAQAIVDSLEITP